MSNFLPSDLDKQVIDAHHKCKTTKEKLDYVNSNITTKSITKTIYYRILKKLQNNLKTQHCVNKGFIVMKRVELVNELENIQHEISKLNGESLLDNMKKRIKLNTRFVRIFKTFEALDNTPHILYDLK